MDRAAVASTLSERQTSAQNGWSMSTAYEREIEWNELKVVPVPSSFDGTFTSGAIKTAEECTP
jgi:hypothetical protein